MKRTYSSGASKRKKAQKEKDKITQLPKIFSFLEKQNQSININNDEDLSEPSTSDEKNTCESEPSTKEPKLNEELESSFITDSTIDIVCTSGSTNECYENDSALWKIDDNMIYYWIKKGPCQNIDQGFQNSVREYKEGDKIKKKIFNG